MDRYAIESLGVPGYTLMCRAGAAAFTVLIRVWPLARRLVVLCGGGNNGGDGYVLARLARAAGLEVEVGTLSDPSKLSGDARVARDECLAAGVTVAPFNSQQLSVADVVVDAIFGIGLDRLLSHEMADQIDQINNCERPILSLDIPSGLHADTGEIMGAAVRATHTVTFIGMKLGCFVGEGPLVTGELHFNDLEVELPSRKAEPLVRRIDESLLARCLLPRRRDTHKGNFGRVLIVGGGRGMPGAVRLSGEACLRAGAGLVTVATRAENVAAIVSGRPELICHGVETAEELRPLLEAATVIVVGPGLGTDEWAQAMFKQAIATGKPTVVDADGLNLLAADPSLATRVANRVLTPHPGEAARLLHTGAQNVQRNRVASLEALETRYGGIIVLKGSGTLISADEHIPELCGGGNPGMATAGMGDVLTGVIAALLGQIGDAWDAVRAAVLVHALAGDAAAGIQGERGLIASDVIAQLPKCLNPASK